MPIYAYGSCDDKRCLRSPIFCLLVVFIAFAHLSVLYTVASATFLVFSLSV